MAGAAASAARLPLRHSNSTMSASRAFASRSRGKRGLRARLASLAHDTTGTPGTSPTNFRSTGERMSMTNAAATR